MQLLIWWPDNEKREQGVTNNRVFNFYLYKFMQSVIRDLWKVYKKIIVFSSGNLCSDQWHDIINKNYKGWKGRQDEGQNDNLLSLVTCIF